MKLLAVVTPLSIYQIQNVPVRREDALVAEDWFGKNLHSLKWKTVRKTTKPSETDFAPLPPHIMSKYSEITVCYDVMKVSGVRFFMLIFMSILLRIAEYCNHGKVDTDTRCIGKIQRLVAWHVFGVVHFDMYEELKTLCTKTSNVLINIVSRE